VARNFQWGWKFSGILNIPWQKAFLAKAMPVLIKWEETLNKNINK
jgi:hypothetical protein